MAATWGSNNTILRTLWKKFYSNGIAWPSSMIAKKMLHAAYLREDTQGMDWRSLPYEEDFSYWILQNIDVNAGVGILSIVLNTFLISSVKKSYRNKSRVCLRILLRLEYRFSSRKDFRTKRQCCFIWHFSWNLTLMSIVFVFHGLGTFYRNMSTVNKNGHSKMIIICAVWTSYLHAVIQSGGYKINSQTCFTLFLYWHYWKSRWYERKI